MGSLVAPAQEPRIFPDCDKNNELSWLQSKNEASTRMVDLCSRAAGVHRTPPKGLVHYWGMAQRAVYPALARRGIAAMANAGSPRTVEGLVSVLRRQR
jgi:hypothetical protein